MPLRQFLRARDGRLTVGSESRWYLKHRGKRRHRKCTMTTSRTMRARRWVATTGAVLALGVGTAAVANAATSPSAATTTAAATAAKAIPSNAPDPATVAHGPG